MSRFAINLVIGILVSSVGCWLAQQFIPAGAPRLIAEVLAVCAGLSPMALGRDRSL